MKPRTVKDAMFLPIHSTPRRTQLGATPAAADPSKVAAALDALVAALGLPPDASPDDVASALDQFFGGGESEAASFAPPQKNPPAKLSRIEREAIARTGITEAAFLAAKKKGLAR